MQIEDVVNSKIVSGLEDAFYVLDLGALARRAASWRELFPRTRPVFGLRCNLDAAILNVLHWLDFVFAVDGLNEAKLLAHVLKLNSFDPDQHSVVCANPQVPRGHIQAAHALGVRKFAFNADTDLSNFQQLKDVELVLQLRCEPNAEANSTRRVSTFADAEGLLKAARDAGLRVVGLSLAAGGGAWTPEHLAECLRLSRHALAAAARHGHEVRALDLGSAWPASQEALARLAAAVGPLLGELVPEGVALTAEPSRFLVQEIQTLAVNVIARRDVQHSRPADSSPESSPPPLVTPSSSASSALSSLGSGAGPSAASAHADPQSHPHPHPQQQQQQHGAPSPVPDFLFYVNEGVYGSFNPATTQGAAPPQIVALPLRAPAPGEALYNVTVYGQTCDSLDCILRHARLPRMEVGDWLLFPAMGHAMSCASTNFNGFARTPVFYVWSGAPPAPAPSSAGGSPQPSSSPR
eukprot:tig00000733_g3770.t1